MAILDTATRTSCRSDWTQETMGLKEPISGVVKADVQAAVDALDNFLNTNAAAINNAIPLPARSALTTAQKARLLMYVIKRRYTVGA